MLGQFQPRGVIAAMRMDNETYRFKVENLFNLLQSEGDTWHPTIQADLEHLALSPRKGRYFLRVVSTQPRDVQLHFYRFYMRRAQREDAIQDLERHIRHMFYEAREDAKEVLAQLAASDTLLALLRVIALTEEGWLAGELIRIVLAAPSEALYEPIRRNLQSSDYLLQCLSIYLIGKSGDEELLDALAKFYRRPQGEKVDRLEKKAYDAMLEGGRLAQPRLLLRWLRDRNSRVRDVALELTAERVIPEAVSDLVGLVLIDSRSRAKAANVLLSYEEAGLVGWDPAAENSRDVGKLMNSAKPAPLIAALRGMLREESAVVREVAVKLSRLAPPSEELTAQLRRLVTEDKASSVQIAAMQALFALDREKLSLALIELFSADSPSRDAIEAADFLMEMLSHEETQAITQGIRTRLARREAALGRFVASVEWWRHDT